MSYPAGPSIDQCYILLWIQPFIIWIFVCLHLRTISLAQVFSITLSGQRLHHTLCMLKMLGWAEHFMQDFMQSMSGNIWMDHLSHPCLSIIVIAFLSGWPLTILYNYGYMLDCFDIQLAWGCSHLDINSVRKLRGDWPGQSILSQTLYFIAFNFLFWTSCDCGILHMMWIDRRDLSRDHGILVL